MSVCLSKSTVGRIFLWMLLIACLSSLVTYQIGLLLPWAEINQSEVHRHVRINRVLLKEVVQLDSALSEQEYAFRSNLVLDKQEQPQELGKVPLTDSSQTYHKNVEVKRKSTETRIHSRSQVSQILARLKQVEAKLEQISSYRNILALGLNKNQTESFQNTATKFNFTVLTSNRDKGNISVIWTLMKTENFPLLPYQQINQIPALQNVISQPDFLCHLHNIYSKITESFNSSCFMISSPERTKSSSSTKFILYDGNVGVHVKSLADVKGLGPGRSIFTTSETLLTLHGQILHVKIPVYVASMFPLRVYMFEEYVDRLMQPFSSFEGKSWLKNARKVILTSLLMAEYNIFTQQDKWRWCRCSQLLEYHMVFTNSHPLVLEIKPLLYPENSEILSNIMSLMLNKETVSMDTAVALSENSQNILLSKTECKKGFGVCLLDTDMVYLLDNAMEAKAFGQFEKIYPSIKDDYLPLITKLQHLWMAEKSLNTLNQEIPIFGRSIPQFHSTPEVHSLLNHVESYISSTIDYTEEDLLSSNMVQSGNFNRHLKSSDTKDYMAFEDNQDTICNSGTSDALMLKQLDILPFVDLKFDPKQLEYDVTVSYDTILLQLHASAQGCHCQVRFDNISGSLSQSNFTVGLGDNIIKIHIVDTSARQPVIVNTYTINVYRHTDGQTGSADVVLQTCTLKQDCSLKFLPGIDCGLQLSNTYKTWNQFVTKATKLPNCKEYQDFVDAQWVVPCKTCNNRQSCYWQQARWQPDSCVHQSHNAGEVKRCFKGKKILFIGDSTNRGIMHYILEKINGSLSEWDKTHDLKLYTSVNSRQTVMSFAYYPQFWLPNNHRPGFDKAVYQLIKWTSPLENNSNTVLVVGGVHWLGKQHINVIFNALKREGLTGIKLVMKGHGAGFHQHVEGVHYADLDHQQRLGVQEREVGRYAASCGFSVVPTFTMTMSRYKDFLQGKCACHFHKVTTKRDHHGQRLYHIEGEINAAYSDLVINTICENHPG